MYYFYYKSPEINNKKTLCWPRLHHEILQISVLLDIGMHSKKKTIDDANHSLIEYLGLNGTWSNGIKPHSISTPLCCK